MIKNLLTVAFRNIQRQKLFTFLHLFGLSVGLVVFILIGLYSKHELSYDQFHKNADRIYRINQTFIWGDDDALFGSTGPAVMQAVQSEVPEFEEMTRVHPIAPTLVSNNTGGNYTVFEEEHILAVDSNFLQVFTFPLSEGNPKTALSHPYSLIITESMAEKYFGDHQAYGKYLELGNGENKKTYQITGVAADTPENSHIEFDFLFSMSSIPGIKQRSDSWIWTTFVTFGLLRPDADSQIAAAKVAKVPGKYLNHFLEKYRGITYKEFLESGETWDLFMQPLLDIHLPDYDVYSRLNETGDIQTIYILWLVGALVLVLSIINFINLSTARATTRAKEVGVRKVIGSGRKLLIYQFLTESALLVVMSSILALFLVEMLLPLVNNILEVQLTSNTLFTTVPALITIAFILGIALLGGLYPAFYLSSFRPAEVLKGKVSQGLGGKQVRNILVTAQFAISIMMIGCTLLIYDQVRHWQALDLGFDRDNKLIIEHVERLGTSIESFKNDALSNSMVDQVSASSDTPPLIYDFDKFGMKGHGEKQISVNYLTSDENFIPLFGLTIQHGRGISKSFNDSMNVVVNTHLVKSFGFDQPENALNQHLNYNGEFFRIIGIVDDFNTSLTDQNYPFAIFAENAPIFRDPSKEITISLNREASGEELMVLIESLKANWMEISPQSPFSYSFVDQEYLAVFESAIRFGKILSGLSLIAICIACLGLVGLVAFVIEKRNKEIGIRKVLGASMANIWLLLSTGFGKLLFIGFFIGAPASWIVISRWVENYPVRDDLSVGTLILAGGIMLLISVLTMSFQTLKASRINPVDYLKEE